MFCLRPLDVEQGEGWDQTQVRSLQLLDEFSGPWRRLGQCMGQYVNPAVDGNTHAIHIRRMGEDRHMVTMCLVDRSLGSDERQEGHFSASLVGTGKQFDSIRTFRGMITHQINRLFRSLRVLYMDMILVEKITNVHRLNRPDRLSDRENAWAAQLPAFDAVAQCESIVQHGGDVEHGGEAPTVENRVTLLTKLLYAEDAYSKK